MPALLKSIVCSAGASSQIINVFGAKLTVGSPKTCMIFGAEENVPQELVTFKTTL